MKILITGADGQLGNELKKILKLGYSEIGKLQLAYDIAEVILTDISLLDITNREQVWDCIVEKHQPQIIFNCAAYTNVDKCETHIDLAYKINTLGAQYVAQAAKAIGAELVHISTDYVFSGESKFSEGYREWDQVNPESVYGKSKLMGEEMLLKEYPQSFVVRTAWLYGYEGSNFVKTIIKLAKEKGVLKVVNDQIGNPTNANDLAHHLLKLPFSKEYGIYHCTNEGICSWYDFAKEIIRLANIDCEIMPCTTEEFPRPAKRPAFSALENLHFKSTTGNAMRSWQDAIKNYVMEIV